MPTISTQDYAGGFLLRDLIMRASGCDAKAADGTRTLHGGAIYRAAHASHLLVVDDLPPARAFESRLGIVTRDRGMPSRLDTARWKGAIRECHNVG
jgi:hypothetical protein